MIKQNGIPEFEHIVCGGGLVGAVWALYLRRRSNSVALFESYYDLRQQLIPGGRSINLVLARKALDPLQELGIREQVLKNTIPIKGQTLHRSNGENYKLCYGLTEQDHTFCVPRNKLSECLLDIVESNNIPIYFEHTLISGDIQKNQYVFRVKNYDEQTEVKVRAKYMYGTDGAGSKVRELILKQKGKQSNIEWYPADYKQLFVPINSETDDYPFDPNWVHLWPRGGQLMMGHPNANGSFSLTLVLPSKGPNSFEELDSEQKIEAYFNTNFPQLAEKIPNLYLQFSENPIGYLGTIRCPEWHYKDKVVILGDAAHTICPFVWQAVNVGMDDCFHLDKIIDKYGFGQKAFEEYFNLQKPKADALADLTLNNFETLATLGNQQQFIKLKKIQKQMQRVSPESFWSKYRMIFFGDRPYNEILALYKKFEAFLIQSKDKLADPQKRRLLLLQQQFKKLAL